jgi:starch synthase
MTMVEKMSKKKSPLRVLMVFSEVAPFAKTGGLADVAGALPRALSELGCTVSIVMPFYNRFVEEIVSKNPLVEDLPVRLGSQLIGTDVYRGKLNDAIDVYFIRRDEFFDRTFLYGTPKGDYFDNFQRFTYFCRAVLALCPAAQFQPDVVHCHDWQSGLIPAYLRFLFDNEDYWAETASMFTIHNIAYQGQFKPELYPDTGLPSRFFSTAGMEFWGGINFMKAAIVCADVITTVSPRYSEEIQTREYGQGLEGVLQMHRHKLWGIINGADYEEWNPETDPYIAANYSRENLDGKRICKLDLLRAVKLPERLMNRPLLGVISRLADQKGFDLLIAVMEKIVARDLGLVILGVGGERYHTLLTELAEQYPDKIAVRLDFDERLAHKIEAGADMFLMPSRYEPCGLNQMYSLRYGTVPVVRATGGLHDTISPFSLKRDEGVGFRFTKYDPAAFWHAIETALDFFQQTETWQKIMKNGMAKDFNWLSSARAYLKLYKKAVDSRRAASSKERAAGSKQPRDVLPATKLGTGGTGKAAGSGSRKRGAD